jgi:hypothetical protein
MSMPDTTPERPVIGVRVDPAQPTIGTYSPQGVWVLWKPTPE